MPNERYIGDGVYASLDPARMIVLSTVRHDVYDLRAGERHWIALEPEALTELMRFAYDIGWGDLILAIAGEREKAREEAEYARDEEDKQRKRDAAEGFDENA